jgi:redox-sensitive bicupin YhaK (pirin superfamily)
MTRCGGLATVAAEPVHELFAGREVVLGESTRVRRVLPNLGRRLVGPWCFVDHYGPDEIATSPGMQVPPHPHIGLQTVSWLLTGEVRHRDSIGSDQLIRPGELGLMTSGAAIAHAEQSPPVHPAMLHGVQLWVALPDTHRHAAPTWSHHADLPVLHDRGISATVIMGETAGSASPAAAFSPIVGIDVQLSAGADASLPLEAAFEHAALVMSGWAEVDGVRLEPGTMLYLGTGRTSLRLASEPGARLMVLGGEPFEEQIVMWWNFVARTGEEIATARERWVEGAFGAVAGFGPEDSLAAPPLPPGRLKPGGRTR